MRIAIITSGFAKDEKDFGGAAVFNNFVKELSLRKGIEVTVFAFYYPAGRQEYDFYKAKVFSFAGKSRSKFHKPGIWRRCRRKFEEEHRIKKFDLIHALWCGEPGYIASQLSRQFSIPLAASICGGELAAVKSINYGSQMKFWQRYFVKETFEQASVIVAGSDYIIDKIRVYRSGKYSFKTVKIPFGVDEKFTSPPSSLSFKRGGVDNQSLNLISTANAVPVKSHIDLLKAFKIVLQKYPDAKLTCCGNDYEGILSNLVNDFGLTGKVDIKGFVEYENLPSLFSSSGIFVLSSLYESQNMSIIEAAFCGLPVVSTRVGIAPEITPYVSEPGDYEKLADNILYVISNYEKVKAESGDRLPGIQERFSMRKCVDEYLKLYVNLIG